MSEETTAVIRGRVHETVQLRHTERGTLAARFTVMQVAREYDRARRQWRDGEPVPLICTVTGPLARHAAECLTGAVQWTRRGTRCRVGAGGLGMSRTIADRSHVNGS
ncbi:hypothetical protein [Streptomyces sp. NPDC050534]|uniref:hypothetical protein n=1 Tax=Streptomyces sp. NPDC050534 TaxID=3365625 RepID=UPI0037ADA9FD